jgi:hypothetical protein
VRAPNPRLIRLAGLTRGAIVEQGDGELLVSPLQQPIIELASPLNIVTPSPNILGTTANPLDESFYIESKEAVNGIVVATTRQLVTLAKGAWELECGVSYSWNLASFTTFSGLYLKDPDTNQAAMVEFSHQVAGLQFAAVEREFHLIFQRDGFQLIFFRAATSAAGDNASLHVSINGRRIL